MYAAFLQYMTPAVDGSPQGLWVLNAFKTENGYWKVEDATRDEEFDESAEDQREDGVESRE